MNTESTLLIFDIHQDTNWIQRILEKEDGNFTHLLLGGDYFDAKSDRAGSIADICALLLELEDKYGDDMTLLWGNHDIHYLETIPTMRRHQNPRHQRYKIPGDYSNSKAKKLSKLLPRRLLDKGRLFTKISGHLISHAGIAAKFWPSADSAEASIETLNRLSHEAMLKLPYEANPLLLPGKTRGGDQATGGLTWLDFDEEFEDALQLPQIFGHTPSFAETIISRARRKGNSWCLDGAQTIYGILDASGELSIRET